MGDFARFWRSSIRAAYTPSELLHMLPPAPGRDWEIKGGFIDLALCLGPRETF
jgi:hypothetical protein